MEFVDICKTHLGRSGEFVAIVFSLVAIIGATIVFWVLMSNFLYNSGMFIHGKDIHVCFVSRSDNGCVVYAVWCGVVVWCVVCGVWCVVCGVVGVVFCGLVCFKVKGQKVAF